MPKHRPRVVITRKLPQNIETRMSELFDARLRNEDVPMTREELTEAMSDAKILVPTITDVIDEPLISAAGADLELIANFGAGVDHIDINAAHERDILVTNTPGATTEDTADMAIGLIIAVARRIPEGLHLMRSGDWSGWSPTALTGSRLTGKRLGILGMGRIGEAVARRARAFGMQIHYHNRNRLSEQIEAGLEATYWSSLDQMVSRMDVISINCPHTPSTYHLMNSRRLKLMKPTAIIVNTSRGEVIDQIALTRMLQKGTIAGAGLDVFEKGHEINPRLRRLNNAVLLPHMGSATVECREEMGERVLVNIKTFTDGHCPPDLVLDTML